MPTDFFEVNKGLLQREIWSENFTSVILLSIERTYKPDLIREWGISEMIVHGEKTLLKWHKRIIPLNEQQMLKRFTKAELVQDEYKNLPTEFELRTGGAKLRMRCPDEDNDMFISIGDGRRNINYILSPQDATDLCGFLKAHVVELEKHLE